MHLDFASLVIDDDLGLSGAIMDDEKNDRPVAAELSFRFTHELWPGLIDCPWR
jgi:hypothetical protein